MLIMGSHENVLLTHLISFMGDALQIGTNACGIQVEFRYHATAVFFSCMCMYFNVCELTERLTMRVAEC